MGDRGDNLSTSIAESLRRALGAQNLLPKPNCSKRQATRVLREALVWCR